MKTKKTLQVLMAGVMGLVLLAGCGNESAEKSSTATSTASSAATSAAAGEDTSLKSVQESGKLVIATTGDLRPYTYKDENNQLVGYDIEWGNIIAEQLGVEAEFVTGQFSGLIPGLEAGRFDVVISGLQATDERKAALNMTEPYAKDGVVAVVKKGSDAVTDISNLEGAVIGANAGSVFESTVKEIGGYKELKTYPGPNESFADLKNGRLDAIALGMVSAINYLENSEDGDLFEIVGEPYKTLNVSIAAAKGADALTEAINAIIVAEAEKGTIEKLSEEHLGVYVK